MALLGLLHQHGNCLHAWGQGGKRCVVCGAGAALQRILLGLSRLLGPPFSCACLLQCPCLRSVYILVGISSDTNEGFVACRHIMLYLTYTDPHNNHTCFSKIKKQRAHGVCPGIAQNVQRAYAYACVSLPLKHLSIISWKCIILCKGTTCN